MTQLRVDPAIPSPSRSTDLSATVQVRSLDTLEEFQACAALQEEVWGRGFSERVPVSLLKVATYIGGIAGGAFVEPEGLVGMVFGLTGVHDGRLVHWSHMLAVRASARNLGIGRRLKEFQRAELARRGIPEMMWSFDPLLAKNAHLNLDILGARVVRFEPNMYGASDSPLHHALETDRLVVACATSAPHRRSDAGIAAIAAPLLTLEAQAGDELLERTDILPPRLRVEVPAEFPELAQAAPARAAAWHQSVRAQLRWALSAGYAATGFHRDAVTSRAFYLLEREAFAS